MGVEYDWNINSGYLEHLFTSASSIFPLCNQSLISNCDQCITKPSKYLGVLLVIGLLGSNPLSYQVIFDCVSQRRKVIPFGRHIAVFDKGVVQMAVEGFLQTVHVLDDWQSSKRDLPLSFCICQWFLAHSEANTEQNNQQIHKISLPWAFWNWLSLLCKQWECRLGSSLQRKVSQMFTSHSTSMTFSFLFSFSFHLRLEVFKGSAALAQLMN